MKDNKLIADFMDLPIDISQPSGILNYGFDDVWFEECELSFESSWDWLMPVVIKIGGSQNILGAMHKLRPYSLVVNIDDTYQAVVEFIKQHNNER
mgnify:CR=1 FL=1